MNISIEKFATYEFFAYSSQEVNTKSFKGLRLAACMAGTCLTALVESVARGLFAIISPVLAIYYSVTYNDEGLKLLKTNIECLGVSAMFFIGLTVISPITIPILAAFSVCPDSWINQKPKK